MKKASLMLVFFLLIIAGSLIAGCDMGLKEKIRNEIVQANYCSVKEDCVDAGSKCPFGCYNYVNKAEAERINNLINSYQSNCEYGCIQIDGVECNNQKCVVQTSVD